MAEAVFDGPKPKEAFFDWVADVGLAAGDEIRVDTDTHGWESWLRVTGVLSDEVLFRSPGGTQHVIVWDQLQEPQPLQMVVRRHGDGASRGVLQRVEVR